MGQPKKMSINVELRMKAESSTDVHNRKNFTTSYDLLAVEPPTVLQGCLDGLPVYILEDD